MSRTGGPDRTLQRMRHPLHCWQEKWQEEFGSLVSYDGISHFA
jgi:hypothetical protein